MKQEGVNGRRGTILWPETNPPKLFQISSQDSRTCLNSNYKGGGLLNSEPHPTPMGYIKDRLIKRPLKDPIWVQCIYIHIGNVFN